MPRLFAIFISLCFILTTTLAQAQGTETFADATEELSEQAQEAMDSAGEGGINAMEKIATITQPDEERLGFVVAFEEKFEVFVGYLGEVLFFPIFHIGGEGMPFVVAWLIGGGIFFTFRLGFVNLRMFSHGFMVATGKYEHKDDPGEVSPFASLSAAVSGTVGLGNIAGVAVAVSLGGPGAVIWLMVAGFLGMSTKFAEVMMGHKYRKIDAEGKVSGGAFYYLRDGLADIGMAKLGKILAVLFAILCLGGAFGGGNMFQSNQSVLAISTTFGMTDMKWVIALIMAFAVGIVLIGGVKRIAQVAEIIVPLMALVYIVSALIVICMHFSAIPEAMNLMFSQAFDLDAAAGGMIGALIMGFRRAAFSNEAGVGSAPIVMSATKSREPVQVGSVAILEPFIDTMIICFLTGLMITVTGVYISGDTDGVLMTAAAFGTVVSWFPDLLSVAVGLFAFSTMITWSYYGERSWNYLFGNKNLRVYHIAFCTAVFFGGVIDFGVIIEFSDLLLLSMALPNLLGLYLMSGTIRKEMKSYTKRLKSGEIIPAK